MGLLASLDGIALFDELAHTAYQCMGSPFAYERLKSRGILSGNYWLISSHCVSQKYMLSARDINFVKPAEGHHDFPINLALLLEAAKYAPRGAKGKLRDY
jgi:hypothetical protein